MTSINNKYKMSQAELYGICRLGWNFAKQHQAQLAVHFPIYTTLFIDDNLALIQATQDRPGWQARNAITEIEHNNLIALGKQASGIWQILERHIIRAHQHQPENIKPNIEAAGGQYYATATRENPDWEDLFQMVNDGYNYALLNLPILTPYISAIFMSQYLAIKDDLKLLLDTFTADENQSEEATAQKIIANNDIYEKFMLMLGDLQQILPAHLKDNATLVHLKSIISSPGPAGLKGTITQAITNTPINQAELILIELDKQAQTDTDGTYNFGPIASGRYTLQITHPLYTPLSQTVTIAVGVTSTHSYTLTLLT